MLRVGNYNIFRPCGFSIDNMGNGENEVIHIKELIIYVLLVVIILMIFGFCNATPKKYQITYKPIIPYDSSFLYGPGWADWQRNEVIKWWQYENKAYYNLLMARDQFPVSGYYKVWIERSDLDEKIIRD